MISNTSKTLVVYTIDVVKEERVLKKTGGPQKKKRTHVTYKNYHVLFHPEGSGEGEVHTSNF